MTKKIRRIILGLLILQSCNNKYHCSGIENGKFVGYAIVFYHNPVSGGNYEMLIAPVCSDTEKLTEDLKTNITLINILSGVSSNININDVAFAEVFKKSQKLKLLNTQTLAPQFRVIYACPVYIELSNVQNHTQSITGTNKKSLREKLIFENEQELTLDYFFSTQIKVSNIRVL